MSQSRTVPKWYMFQTGTVLKWYITASTNLILTNLQHFPQGFLKLNILKVGDAVVHALIIPEGAADIILMECGMDVTDPADGIFLVCKVDYAVLAAVKRDVILFSLLNCGSEDILEDPWRVRWRLFDTLPRSSGNLS